jgi:hypothetical protein
MFIRVSLIAAVAQILLAAEGTAVPTNRRLVSWYGTFNASSSPASWSPDDLGKLGFTHVVASAGTGIMQVTGVVTCNMTSPQYLAAAPLRAAGAKHGFKIMVSRLQMCQLIHTFTDLYL